MTKQTQCSSSSTPEAINLESLSSQEVSKTFKKELGFDPANLDELASQLKNPESGTVQDINKLLELQKQMSEMLITRFAANMEAFRKYLPNIYEQFINYQPSEPLEFVCTSNGIPNLYYPQRDSFFYKSFDPVKLCQAQVDLFIERGNVIQIICTRDKDYHGQLHYRYTNELAEAIEADCKKFASIHPNHSLSTLSLRHSTPIAILLGCGLGYHIGYLYEKIEIGNLIIVEPDKDLFFASLHAFDWANLLEFVVANNRGIYFMVGQSENEVMGDLSRYYNRHSHMLAYVLCAITHYHSPKIDELEKTICRFYAHNYEHLGFVDDSVYAISHAVKNMQQKVPFAKRDVALPEKFTKTPLFVIANGPSLSNDLAVIRRLQDKAVILACGSSIETLYIAGIKPDIYVCTERARNVQEHLNFIPDKDFIKDCLCLSLDVNHPKLKDFFDKRLTFIKTDEIFAEMLYKAMPEKYFMVKSLPYTNPLVGNFGVTAAWTLGFKNIYLFGLDNGTKREDGYTHAAESVFYQKGNSIDTKNAATLDGNFGGKVFINNTYHASVLALESSLRFKGQNFPDTVVYNCSDGAKIEHTIPLHSNILLELYSKNKDFPRQDFFDYMLKEQAYLIEPNEQELQAIEAKEDFDQALSALIKFIDERDVSQFHTRVDYALFLQSIYERMFTKNGNNHIFLLLVGSISILTSLLLNELYKIDDEQKAIEATDKNLKYLKYLLEDSKRIYQYVPEYCMLDHLQFFEKGKLGYDHPDSPAPDFVSQSLVELNIKKKLTQTKFIKRYE